MTDEQLFEEPTLELTAIVTRYKNKPELLLVKHIHNPEKILLLANLILADKYIPARITVKDLLKFKAKLIESNLLKK